MPSKAKSLLTFVRNQSRSVSLKDFSRLSEDLKKLNRGEVSLEQVEQLKDDYEQSRRLWAKYGSQATGLGPCWPSDLGTIAADEKEYGLSLEQKTEIIEGRKKQRIIDQKKRQSAIVAKMAKLPGVMAAFEAEKQKRMKGAHVVDSEREKLLEDAQDYYGFKIDATSDRRMQLMLEELEEQKAVEAKKMRKAERIKDAEKVLESLIKEAESADEQGAQK